MPLLLPIRTFKRLSSINKIIFEIWIHFNPNFHRGQYSAALTLYSLLTYHKIIVNTWSALLDLHYIGNLKYVNMLWYYASLSSCIKPGKVLPSQCLQVTRREALSMTPPLVWCHPFITFLVIYAYINRDLFIVIIWLLLLPCSLFREHSFLHWVCILKSL